MAPAKSHSRKAQSQRDKKANHQKQKAAPVSGVKEQESEANKGTAGMTLKSLFKAKHLRPEKEVKNDHKKQERQRSPERKRRGVDCS